jgi:hypothetical protein
VNLLIFGGLLVLGLLAIVGIIWTIRSEPSTAQNAPAPSTPIAATTPTVPVSPEKNTAPPQRHSVAVDPLPVTEAPSGTKEVEPPINGEEEPFPISNGQLHELAAQLRTLHQQSQEIERRLSVLTNMIDHIQRSQNDQSSIEELEELDTTQVPSAR